MFYQAELKFLQNMLATCRVQLQFVSAAALLKDAEVLTRAT